MVGKFDKDMNLYWVSWKENQHSQNIAQDPRIFVVIYDSRVPEGQGEGLYLQMRAHELAANELDRAHKIYAPSFFKYEFRHDQFLSQCPQRIYKATPEHIWYNVDSEAQGHFADKRAALVCRP